MVLKNFNNFLIISRGLVNDSPELVSIDEELFCSNKPFSIRGHFCFFHGIIHNYEELKSLYAIKEMENPEELLINLYSSDPVKFPTLLKGNFAVVIGNKNSIYLLRDGNGYENLYFSCENKQLIITNSVKESGKYFNLEVNTGILPEYFLKTDINSGETFFKGIHTLAFFEQATYNRSDFTLKKSYFDEFFTVDEIVSKVRINEIINECDSLIEEIIKAKAGQVNNNFTIINSFSGGTDSSCIQYYLKKANFDIAYTANFKKTGLDHQYASDVAGLMNLKQKTIHSDTGYLVNSLEKGIYISEKPFLFAGETLLMHMYEEIGKDFNLPVACFDGTGAEGILGASRLLFELRITRKYKFAFNLLLPFIKIKSPRLYARLKEFHKFSDTRNIPGNFILRYFTDTNLHNIVKEAFNLSDLVHIDHFEMSMLKRYNTTLFESIYRYLAFELEYRRVNNMRTQLAKAHNISLIFPFTETDFFKYLIKFDTEIKLRNAKTKYIFRKALEKKFPKNIVYRKKVRKNVSVSDELLKNEKAKEIINEIKERKYSYFNFDYDRIFGSPQYSALAYKLINFHEWHKLFIDKT